ncbi:unnamed protein product [Bemisia tabaci]|uniref:Gag-like protein n=1 Tax=Bemisia tabaci TaxID=7038 RepID=A0A9P0A7G2_BEMTA|nr:unnamed protein product [Bemisia tabaci]
MNKVIICNHSVPAKICTKCVNKLDSEISCVHNQKWKKCISCENLPWSPVTSPRPSVSGPQESTPNVVPISTTTSNQCQKSLTNMDWQLVVNKRKKNGSIPSSPSKSSTKKPKILVKKPIASGPKTKAPPPFKKSLFAAEVLAEDTAAKNQEERNLTPPPIFIYEVGKPVVFQQVVLNPISEDFLVKVINKSQIKVISPNISVYNQLKDSLKVNNVKYHTYQIKEERAFKVIIRGLPIDYPIEDIKNSLECVNNLEVESIFRLKSFKTGNFIPLVQVNFSPITDKNKKTEIFKIKSIDQLIVKLEPVRPKKTLSQCKKCMCFGHTHRYCAKDPRCLKCAGPHDTSECTKSIEVPPTCALCGEHHTANWRGCKVYREIRKRKFEDLRETKAAEPVASVATPRTASAGTRSYASATKGGSGGNAPQTATPDKASMSVGQFIKIINSQNEIINKLQTQVNSLLKQVETLVLIVQANETAKLSRNCNPKL